MFLGYGRVGWRCFLVAACAVLAACGGNSSDLSAAENPSQSRVSITGGHFMAPLPTKTMTSGYFELNNGTDAAVELVNVSSPVAKRVEMHDMVKDGDQVRMQQMPKVVVAPGTSVTFAKGGKHLMVFEVAELPTEFPVTLHFADGSQQDAQFTRQQW